ncbi:single-stranded DNA-binding protein [Galbibacter orientalis]|uniref:Single-stranded DNA-binding protein n=1 Tax=Galbibacter orientalis DSM 19592 TaxID=926559 RepID=I3C1I5_9FLAO|nr:single-stranded DNA-binding protein [Galbibacter orientalis]EIJ37478.1 single stranded DNA-binding protein [Galbibacter orientalis DSM 19592]EIJ37530.1 single stranded DNA-binding protein [Galbibacter orientalis DSM 19592]EIJ37590.1 single stranded DNA-binding protein [Galbibacter orientalis DSM 19592]EIJ40707.1 single stranded DNA-binding protein [Galbibacter orientalis DSM 19592]
MSTLKNQVQLIGNVGQEPQVTVLDNGKKVARISLATNENFKNSKGEKQTNTDWHQLVAWGKVASLIEDYVFTGKEIAVQGKLSSRSYEDKEGVKRYVTEVIVSEILFLGGNQAS